jgi:hypothetical protein
MFYSDRINAKAQRREEENAKANGECSTTNFFFFFLRPFAPSRFIELSRRASPKQD